jgi:hypothetical protein
LSIYEFFTERAVQVLQNTLESMAAVLEEDVMRCCMCCRALSSSEPAQLHNSSSMRQYLNDVFVCTPFLWKYLNEMVKGMELSLERKQTELSSSTDDCFMCMCVACDAWVQRNSKDCVEKRLLYVDQIILFMIMPGKYCLPERRGCMRVLQNMRMDNPIVSCVTPSMLRYQLPVMGPSLTEASMLYKWWDYNGRPFIVGSAALAKKLRRVVSCEVPE